MPTHDPAIPVSSNPALPATVALAPERIASIFDAAKSQADYIVGLHRLVYGDAWDHIAELRGFVQCSEEVSKFIFGHAIQWDRQNNPTSSPVARG